MSTSRTQRLPFFLACTIACLAPHSRAVHLDPQGFGQVLLFPYYTVNDGRASVLSVVNPTGHAKAIKVRVREAVRGRSVLDFNLYLAPNDVYTAALVAGGMGAPAQWLSTDASCTVPALTPLPGANFTVRELRHTGPADGPAGVERTREGWIELIEMGVVEDTYAEGVVSFGEAVRADRNRPADCAKLDAAWNGGVWSVDATRAAGGDAVGVSPPRGGLYGGAVIVDVGQGIAFPYAPEAIDGFFRLSSTTLHTPPGSAKPDLASAETEPGRATARIFAGERAVDLEFVAGRPDAVSSVLMAAEIYNEYSIDPALGAATEWVVTFPTRHLHYLAAEPARRRPFVGTDADCELFSLAFFDRHAGPERHVPFDAPPPPPRLFSFCHHAQVLPWAARVPHAPSRLLGSRLLAHFGDSGTNDTLLEVEGAPVLAGHVAMGFSLRFLLDGSENGGQVPRRQLFGLPFAGFSVSNYVNAQARPGLLANFSTTTRHRILPLVRSVRVTGEGTAGETIVPVEPDGRR